MTKAEMAESGMAGRFWFSASIHGKNCRNVTFKQRLGTTPHAKMYGEKADVSKFRPFGCRAYVHLNKERRAPGKHTPRAVEAIHLGFASDRNMSAYKFYIPSTGQLMYSNQAKFDEDFFPYRNKDMIEGQLADDLNVDILSQLQKDVKWIEYDDRTNLHDFEKVHVNTSADQYTLRSIISPDTYMKMTRESFFAALLKQNSDELLIKARALVAKMGEELKSETDPSDDPIKVKGLPNSIDSNKPPRNYRDAMSREDRQEWATAYMEEYQGFHEQGTLKVARPEPGAKILDTTTRADYKVTNGVFGKRKIRLCVCGNQQVEGVHYNAGNLYAPVMKASEVRLMVAIAAQNKTKLLKTDTKQAFLNGDIGDEKIYIRPPDWWPEPVPKGHALLLMKSMYGTRQAARQWHERISGWMEEHEYHAINNEKTMFMKWEGSNYIMHGLFVDDMMHTSTSQKMLDKFFKLYAKSFKYTGGDLMTSFLGMEVEQDKGEIRLHLDTYIQEMLNEYQAYIKKDLKPKKVPMQPGVILTNDDCPEFPDPREQTMYQSFLAKAQFAAQWIRYDAAYTTSQLARFCASAGVSHWAALHHLMGYLKHTSSFKLTYRSGKGHGLDGFADSDWGNSVSRRSTTGLLARYNKTIVLWRSKLQKTISLSTAEAEYYAASEIAIEIIYLRNLLSNMGFPQGDDTPVYEDNTACIEWGNHIIGGRERAKHIDIRKHFAHEVIQNRHMRLIRVSTTDQLADIFTKALPMIHFERCVRGLMCGPDPKGP